MEKKSISKNISLRSILNLWFGLLPFSFIRVFFLRLAGNKISFSAKIGWGVYLADEIILHQNARIKTFNFFRVNKIELSKNSFIKGLNYFKGPFDIELGEESGIGRQNKFRRSYYPFIYDKSLIKLGYHTFITSNNFFDLTKSIKFGDNSQLGGTDSQFWTHGYFHESNGKGRIRIDGEIQIGDNVYIGSRCVFNPGITVMNSINIGSNSVVSKDLKEEGMYVSQPLRFRNVHIDDIKSKYSEIDFSDLKEIVYEKDSYKSKFKNK